MRAFNPGCWLLAAAVPLAGQGLAVRLSGDQLKVAAPQLHFLEGKLLDRLRSGSAVIYVVHLSLVVESGITQTRALERCAASYDLWEEKFAVARLGTTPRQSASHLAARAAEAWCLDQLAIGTTGLRDAAPFRLRLELQAEASGDQRTGIESVFTLSRLIDLFSRPAPSGTPRWTEDSGILRLQELRSIPRK